MNKLTSRRKKRIIRIAGIVAAIVLLVSATLMFLSNYHAGQAETIKTMMSAGFMYSNTSSHYMYLLTFEENGKCTWSENEFRYNYPG